MVIHICNPSTQVIRVHSHLWISIKFVDSLKNMRVDLKKKTNQTKMMVWEREKEDRDYKARECWRKIQRSSDRMLCVYVHQGENEGTEDDEER